jgi:hypothetical protein
VTVLRRRTLPFALGLVVAAVMPASALAALDPSPASFDWGAVDRHGISPQQVFQFTNNEGGQVTVSPVAVNGTDAAAFQIVNDNCSNAVLDDGNSCQVTVQVAPGTTGALSASLDVDDGSGVASVGLSANSQTGTLNADQNPIAFNPQPWFFGSQFVNVNVQSQSFGTQITTVSLTGPDADAGLFLFNYDNCAGNLLNAFNSCNLGIVFSPTGPSGPASADLVIDSDSASSPTTIPISANALTGPVTSIDPHGRAFGPVEIGTSSAARPFTVTNTGDYPAQIQQLLVVSGTPQMFPVSNDLCTLAVVLPTAACTFDIAFAPTTAGLKEASIFLITNSPSPVAEIPLSGEGLRGPGVAATVTGVPAVGEQLTCTLHNASGELTFEWLRDGGAIPGETDRTHTASRADQGSRLACRVTATNALGSVSTESPPTAPIGPRNLAGEPHSFVDETSCRVVGVDPIPGVHIRGTAPATPESPLRFDSSAPIRVELGPLAKSGKRVRFNPRELADLSDGPQTFSVDGVGATLVLAPCTLSARVDGSNAGSATYALSGQTGIASGRLRTPKLRIDRRAAIGGKVTVHADGTPEVRFPITAAKTSYNGIKVKLSRHAIDVARLLDDTSTVEVELPRGAVRGRGGDASARATLESGAAVAKIRTAWN